MSRLDARLREALQELSPPSHFEDAAREAAARVEGAVQAACGAYAQLLPRGSFLQGTHLRGSHLDLCAAVPDHPEEPERQEALLRSVQFALPSKLIVTETRFEDDVPVIVIKHASITGASIAVDLAVGVDVGRTDRLIRRALSRVPRAVPLVRAVKQWARVEGLSRSCQGFLGSFGWTLLVLYFFIQQGEAIAYYMDSENRDEEHRSRLFYPIPHDWSVTSELLASFFSMVAGWSSWLADTDGGAMGVSLIDGVPIRGPPDESPFYLEDPDCRLASAASMNVARTLRLDAWRRTLALCRSAAWSLRAKGSVPLAWVDMLSRKIVLRAQRESPQPRSEVTTRGRESKDEARDAAVLQQQSAVMRAWSERSALRVQEALRQEKAQNEQDMWLRGRSNEAPFVAKQEAGDHMWMPFASPGVTELVQSNGVMDAQDEVQEHVVQEQFQEEQPVGEEVEEVEQEVGQLVGQEEGQDLAKQETESHASGQDQGPELDTSDAEGCLADASFADQSPVDESAVDVCREPASPVKEETTNDPVGTETTKEEPEWASEPLSPGSADGRQSMDPLEGDRGLGEPRADHTGDGCESQTLQEDETDPLSPDWKRRRCHQYGGLAPRDTHPGARCDPQAPAGPHADPVTPDWRRQYSRYGNSPLHVTGTGGPTEEETTPKFRADEPLHDDEELIPDWKRMVNRGDLVIGRKAPRRVSDGGHPSPSAREAQERTEACYMRGRRR